MVFLLPFGSRKKILHTSLIEEFVRGIHRCAAIARLPCENLSIVSRPFLFENVESSFFGQGCNRFKRNLVSLGGFLGKESRGMFQIYPTSGIFIKL
ncbi:hypothetical protein CEXT_442171 [Caerostris extrusa]|uniref:Uncharacterized protein n=1 Tax=Caerostris extrusa TaxID=172846 RepID=A0AAV4PZ10_CAEEX|nr:hypothetical protein CEXT_442171 [Caerostris extrusa]